MTQVQAKQSYDPKARAVAQAVYDAIRPLAVILFGSRARGDYRDDSDVDLLVIINDDADDRATYAAARAAAHRKLDELYDLRVGVDVLDFTKSRFAYCRRARNHVAGQALRDGVIVSEPGLNPNDFPADSNDEPANWPDIRQRLIAATRNIVSMTALITTNSPLEDVAFHAQQAVENALKGWISALDDEYRNIHDLGGLAAIVRKHPAENDTPAGESLNWLTRYAVVYRYEGARVNLDDPPGLLEAVSALVDAVADRIKTLTGIEPPRWTPEQRRKVRR